MADHDPVVTPEPFEVSEARITYGDASWEGFPPPPEPEPESEE